MQLNLTKIEQLGSGAVYCQIVDSVHPGKVSMNKVNWKAKNDYEFIANLKILQSAFEKVGIKKHVEVERLARAKYQDNL
jgi:RP/EB family microtubule-associated protein